MEQETVCSHCGEKFSSKGKYKYHYLRVHQMEIKNCSTDNMGMSIVCSMDDKFICICGKGYPVVPSLHRHQLNCLEWKNKQVANRNSEQSEQGISLIY